MGGTVCCGGAVGHLCELVVLPVAFQDLSASFGFVCLTAHLLICIAWRSVDK